MKRVEDYKNEIQSFYRKQKVATILFGISSLYQILCLIFNNNEDFLYPLRFVFLLVAILSGIFMVVEASKLIRTLNKE